MIYSSDTPITFNEFCLAYYDKAIEKAWIIIKSFINQHGTPPNNIELEEVVEDGVTDALERVYKTYDNKKKKGASVTTYLDSVLNNCLVDAYYKHTGLVRKKKKKAGKEDETDQTDRIISSDLFIKGVINKRLELERNEERKDGPEGMTYHSLEGERQWRNETINNICNELKEQVKKLGSIDRVIVEKWILLDKKGYTQAAVEELGITPAEVHRRMNRIIPKLRKKLEYRQEDYAEAISIDAEMSKIKKQQKVPRVIAEVPIEEREARKRVFRRRTDYKALRTRIESFLSALLKNS